MCSLRNSFYRPVLLKLGHTGLKCFLLQNEDSGCLIAVALAANHGEVVGRHPRIIELDRLSSPYIAPVVDDAPLLVYRLDEVGVDWLDAVEPETLHNHPRL